jgi:hypothetical protein
MYKYIFSSNALQLQILLKFASQLIFQCAKGL